MARIKNIARRVIQKPKAATKPGLKVIDYFWSFFFDCVCSFWTHHILFWWFFVKAPKKKGRNWTGEEEDKLVKFVEPYLAIIDCKKSDEVTIAEKNVAWSSVVDTLNANARNARVIMSYFPVVFIYSVHLFQHSRSIVFMQFRSVEECKTKLINLKRRIRTDVAKHRSEVFKTGGGPAPSSVEFNTESQLTLYRHLGVSADGLPSVGDSDITMAATNRSPDLFDSIVDEDSTAIDDEPSAEYIFEIEERDDADHKTDDGDGDGDENDDMDEDKESEDIDEDKENEGIDDDKENDTPVERTPTNNLSSGPNWGKYTPKMLRQKKNYAISVPITKRAKANAPILPSPQSTLRDKETLMRMELQKEKHAKAMLLEDGKIREQKLRILLLEHELRSKGIDFEWNIL